MTPEQSGAPEAGEAKFSSAAEARAAMAEATTDAEYLKLSDQYADLLLNESTGEAKARWSDKHGPIDEEFAHRQAAEKAAQIETARKRVSNVDQARLMAEIEDAAHDKADELITNASTHKGAVKQRGVSRAKQRGEQLIEKAQATAELKGEEFKAEKEANYIPAEGVTRVREVGEVKRWSPDKQDYETVLKPSGKTVEASNVDKAWEMALESKDLEEMAISYDKPGQEAMRLAVLKLANAAAEARGYEYDQMQIERARREAEEAIRAKELAANEQERLERAADAAARFIADIPKVSQAQLLHIPEDQVEAEKAIEFIVRGRDPIYIKEVGSRLRGSKFTELYFKSDDPRLTLVERRNHATNEIASFTAVRTKGEAFKSKNDGREVPVRQVGRILEPIRIMDREKGGGGLRKRHQHESIAEYASNRYGSGLLHETSPHLLPKKRQKALGHKPSLWQRIFKI
jgi:hypothetical protein